MRYELVYMLLPYILVFYCIIIVMFFFQRYLRAYTHNKRLIFTRDSIKEIRQEIDDIILERGRYSLSNISSTNEYHRKANSKGTQIISIMSTYNELAVGINEGLYDELYVKTVMGKQMKDFYKRYYNIVMENNADWDDSQYIPLELLLKRWAEKNAPSYRVKNRRSF